MSNKEPLLLAALRARLSGINAASPTNRAAGNFLCKRNYAGNTRNLGLP